MKRILMVAGILSALTPFLPAQKAGQAKNAAAHRSPKARAWLGKLATAGKKPVEVDLAVTRNIASRDVKTHSTGHLAQADEKHYRLELKTTLTGGRMAGEGMEMNRLSVADGTTLWMQVENPRMGQQVQKASLEAGGGKEGQHAGEGIASRARNANPFHQVKEIAKLAHFSDVQVADGKVVLKGSVDAKALKSHPGMAGLEFSDVTLVLDETTAYPLKVEGAGKDGPAVILTFSNYVFPKELDASKFTYKAPAGVQVQELGDTASRRTMKNPASAGKGKAGVHREGGGF